MLFISSMSTTISIIIKEMIVAKTLETQWKILIFAKTNSPSFLESITELYASLCEGFLNDLTRGDNPRTLTSKTTSLTTRVAPLLSGIHRQMISVSIFMKPATEIRVRYVEIETQTALLMCSRLCLECQQVKEITLLILLPDVMYHVKKCDWKCRIKKYQNE